MRNFNSTHKVLTFAIILILLCVIGYYAFLPFLGITILMTGMAWAIIVATISLFVIASLLFFVIPGLIIIVLSLFAVGWVILAIVLFPFLFPLIMPVFIILLFIAFYSGRNRNKPN